MVYPNKLVQTDQGLSLNIPDSLLVQSVYNQLLNSVPTTAFPYWAKIWPAAKVMAAFLQNESNWIANKKVLEIGAGIGLPSFTIANQASSIIISDYSPDAVELIQKNITYLKINNASAMCLDWNHFPLHLIAETILLSDINYDPSEFEVLNQLIQYLLNQGSTLIIATPQRITATPFVNFLEPFIKRKHIQKVQHENQLLDISIFILHQ